MPELSVIIPTLDEEHRIGPLLEQLMGSGGLAVEVVVADGGSTDETVAVARAAGAIVVECDRGRGRQLNAGRRQASAPLLLFLHADSMLSEPRQLTRAVAAFREVSTHCPRPVAGHFQLRFHDAAGRSFTYYEGLSALGRAQTVNGDQGLLIEAAWLDRLGGFHETLPFLEDQDLGARILASGSWVLLPGRLETSARRFHAEGMAGRSIHNAVTMAFFSFRYAPFLAATPERYRPQGAADQLRVGPLAREVWALVRRDPGVLLSLGRYVNRHAVWRVAFWLDVRALGAHAARRHPRLDAFDRWIAPLIHHRAGDVICIAPMLVVFGWVWADHARRERVAARGGSEPVRGVGQSRG